MKQPYPQQYLDTLKNTEGSAFDAQDVADRFQHIFSNLSAADLQDRVATAYAPEFYFNDTLKTVRTRSDLVAYFRETGEKLDAIEVEMLSAFRDEYDIYLRWRMDMRFSAVGKNISTRTVGMSHLQVNDDGLIILHQDFWDGAEGIYRQLPIVGRFIPGE